MKTKIAICTLTLLAVLSGCSSTPADSSAVEPRQVHVDQLSRERVILFFEHDTGLPYTGEAVERYRGGELRNSINIVYGIPTGMETEYFESGQKKREVEIVVGEPRGSTINWYENGEMRSERLVVDGRQTQETQWYETGQMKSLLTNTGSGVHVARTWDENGVETTIRREIEEALQLSGGAKAAVSEYYHYQGVWPTDNEMAGMAEPNSISSRYVTAITIENGVISISLGNSAADDLSGHVLVWTPESNVRFISWKCSSPDIDPASLPEMCR